MRMCRKIETALIGSAIFAGLISPKLCAGLWIVCLSVMVIHCIANKKYAHEWAQYIFWD